MTQKTRDELPQIPWKNVIGLRNKMIHEYRYVDHDIVWDAATLNLPELIAELEKPSHRNAPNSAEAKHP